MKTEKALPIEIYGTKTTIYLHYITVQSFTTTKVQPTHSAQPPNISFLGTEKMQTKMCHAYSVATQEALHEDSEAKAYPVSAARSQVQGLQWQINDTIQPWGHKIRMERTLLQLGKKDVRHNTVTLQKILDTNHKIRVHRMDGWTDRWMDGWMRRTCNDGMSAIWSCDICSGENLAEWLAKICFRLSISSSHSAVCFMTTYKITHSPQRATVTT